MVARKLIPWLVAYMTNCLTVMLVSSPGVGKTSIAKLIRAILGYDFMILHPVTDEEVDYKGQPWVSVDGIKAKFVPYGNLEILISATRPLIVLIDDLIQAKSAVQAALMQLILERSINGVKISEHVRFIICTNDRLDKAGGQAIIEPLISRCYTVVTLEVDVPSWLEWAETAGISEETKAFVHWRGKAALTSPITGDLKKRGVCPRSVEFADINYRMMKDTNLPEEDLLEIQTGVCGEAWSAEWIGFLKQWKALPTMDEIRHDPANCKFPYEVSGKYALMGYMARECKGKQDFSAIEVCANRLDADFQVVFCDIMEVKHPEFVHTNFYVSRKTNRANQALS